MLEQMRKHMNWIMWGILAVIIVTFLFFGIYPSQSGQGVAAKVNGDIITSSEVGRVYRNMVETYRQIFKDQFNDSMAKTLQDQALRDLIQNRLLVQEAKRIGITVSDDEVRRAIMSVPSFAPQGQFSQAEYERYLDYINMKPSVFEETQRDYLLKRKIERLVEDSVAVTDLEVASAYASRNPKAKPGDFEKNKTTFKQQMLSEKRNSALEAYVQELAKKATIVKGKSMES
ncbi:MAG: SurA N-terminal domain-containing protein [Nitrospiraceae bacterium]|nr:SurA N-terminal domain-containing protein [Nitrospiraceae bacterium]